MSHPVIYIRVAHENGVCQLHVLREQANQTFNQVVFVTERMDPRTAANELQYEYNKHEFVILDSDGETPFTPSLQEHPNLKTIADKIEFVYNKVKQKLK